MRGDGPIRSAMGSLRRGDGTGIGTVGGGRGAVTVCVALMSMIRGPVCSTGFGAGSAVFCTVGLATKGAGRAPDCRKPALTTIRMVAAVAPRMAKESTGRSIACVHSRTPNESVPARAFERLLSLRRSRTFFHRACRLHGAGRLIHGDDDRADHAKTALFHRPRPLAIERQADRDAGALAEAAANREFAAV